MAKSDDRSAGACAIEADVAARGTVRLRVDSRFEPLQQIEGVDRREGVEFDLVEAGQDPDCRR